MKLCSTMTGINDAAPVWVRAAVPGFIYHPQTSCTGQKHTLMSCLCLLSITLICIKEPQWVLQAISPTMYGTQEDKSENLCNISEKKKKVKKPRKYC